MISKKEYVSGLTQIHSGKVRDSYDLPGHEDSMLVVATDRISIFDFVLNAEVKDKGAILTAMNIFWRRLLGSSFPHDLLACGAEIDSYLPQEMREDRECQKRGVVVRKLTMIPVEGIVRGYLTGTGLQAYNETNPHVVCGHMLPKGLVDGSKLPKPIFTPTTKAKVGHDEHITFQSVARQYGNTFESMCLGLYEAASQYAVKRGIIIADSKLEGSPTKLGDEWLTPDSSRFWPIEDYILAQKEKRTPISYDKEFVRGWGKSIGINKKDPKKPEDVAWVQAQDVPLQVLNETTSRYRAIFERLTGKSLEKFQTEDMGIAA